MRLYALILLLIPTWLFGQIYSSASPGLDERVPAIDGLSHGQITVDFEHHGVHEGVHYTFTYFDSVVDDGDSVNFIITTADTTRWTHFVFFVNAALQTEISFSESTTRAIGAWLPTYNNNRNVSDTALTSINIAGNGGSNGLVIFKDHFGISTGVGINNISSGGGARGENEWILKRDTKYLFSATSFSDANVISVKFAFYEHISQE